MGTTKVTVRRTATRKDGASKGTIKTSTKTTVANGKVTTKQSRTATRFSPKGAYVNAVKGS